ncbi:short chain dehydrogenase domain-containing protein [Ditylenchus destructor]|uniref:Short chain dehydrogenase domain-containing protein n=1 Tax=Ditylenchus destructor TaxID=166010 RepID=A0AAD4NAA9_9BILA|nr:short chain dehydrogenase domain-containing protein [Ditylenchus destructor]
MFLWFSGLILASVFVYYTFRYIWESIPLSSVNKSRRAVFITGCDTGFGRLLALKCARNGIPTYAGCLTKQGEESLTEDSKDCREKVVTVPLDVTSDESVNAAARFVEKDITNRNIQLWALVNNAGIFTCYGPDAWTTIDDYKLAMEVNLYGVIRCTHAFLSLLKQSKGRIISPSSVAGRISIPGGGAYSCAKFAVEAYMDSIRLELRPFGITCCILEPGVFRTNLTDNDQMRNRVNRVWDKLSPEIKHEYGEKFKNQFIDLWNSQVGDLASTRLDYVVDSYYHAITAMYPRLRYRCGWDSILFYIPLSFLPTEFIDALFMQIAKGPLPMALIAKGKSE